MNRDHTSQQLTPHEVELRKHIRSMRLVFGWAIIILALVIMGIVFALGDVRIPYISSLFAPIMPSSHIQP